MKTRALLGLFVATIAVAMTACARPPSDAREAPPAIAKVHQSKCSACHRLVEPTTRTRDVIEKAAARHEKRVKLTPDEWRALVDYLAPASASSSAPDATHVNVSESWPSPARPD